MYTCKFTENNKCLNALNINLLIKNKCKKTEDAYRLHWEQENCGI